MVIIDDVICTGDSIDAILGLVEAVGGIATVKDDILFLEELPLFPNVK